MTNKLFLFITLLIITLTSPIIACSMFLPRIQWDEYLALHLGKPVEEITDEDYKKLDKIIDLDHYKLTRKDWNEIAIFENVSSLIVTKKGIDDITVLGELKNLTQITMPYNKISDISALSGLDQLTTLDLYRNNISDITPLSNMPVMLRVDLSYNNIEDISPLSNATSIWFLYLAHNKIKDISSLRHIDKLGKLDLAFNEIEDVSPLSNLVLHTYWKNETVLDLSYNRIKDISPLLTVENLNILYLQGNPLSEQSLNEIVPALEAQGVRVVLEDEPAAPKRRWF